MNACPYEYLLFTHIARPCESCDMAFIVPMPSNKPNIAYLLARESKSCNVFCEFQAWPMFYHCHYEAMCNIVIYCVVIQRESNRQRQLGLCILPKSSTLTESIPDGLKRQRFALHDRHNCSLIWCALSGPHDTGYWVISRKGHLVGLKLLNLWGWQWVSWFSQRLKTLEHSWENVGHCMKFHETLAS